MLPEFELLIPQTLEEAISILSEKGKDCTVVAGGTDVYVDMHGKYKSAPYLMDIKHLEDLKVFSFVPGQGLSIGALTTHHFLDRSPIIRQYYPALFEGASQVGSVQIRHRGTIGGNICNAVPSGDTLGPLLVLNAVAVLAGPGGERRLPLEEFFLGPKKTALQPGELLTHVLLPDPGASRSAYIKFTRRGAMDLALLGVSAYVELAGGTLKTVRIALTTAAPTPIRAFETEKALTGRPAAEETFLAAGKAVLQESHPRSSWRSSAEFRLALLEELTAQALRQAVAVAKEA